MYPIAICCSIFAEGPQWSKKGKAANQIRSLIASLYKELKRQIGLLAKAAQYYLRQTRGAATQSQVD
jgi:hypothetical protein